MSIFFFVPITFFFRFFTIRIIEFILKFFLFIYFSKVFKCKKRKILENSMKQLVSLKERITRKKEICLKMRENLCIFLKGICQLNCVL